MSLSLQDREQLLHLARQGENSFALARTFNVTASRIRQILTEEGIPRVGRKPKRAKHPCKVCGTMSYNALFCSDAHRRAYWDKNRLPAEERLRRGKLRARKWTAKMKREYPDAFREIHRRRNRGERKISIRDLIL